jgi:translation elongation factor EF-4
MASWDDLRSYITSKYKVSSDTGDGLILLFHTVQDRSQAVGVKLLGESGWAGIMTSVAHESQVDLRDLLVRNNNMTVGSLGLGDDGTVVLSHTFPLENLDANEFEEPLERLVMNGDKLELELTGQDRH